MTMPSQEESRPSLFDRFADVVDRVTSRAAFFAFCVGLVVAWIPSFLVVKNIDTWQLLINTPTTVITFLLVALAANVGRRAWAALHAKLNALAEAQAALLEALDIDAPARELRHAVGLENREAS